MKRAVKQAAFVLTVMRKFVQKGGDPVKQRQRCLS